jgi:hypothetical protein
MSFHPHAPAFMKLPIDVGAKPCADRVTAGSIEQQRFHSTFP